MNRKQEQRRYREAFDKLSFSADFEQRTLALLRQRARETEKEPNKMNLKQKFFRKPLALAAAAALLAGAVSAAALWLTPAQVADHVGAPALAQAFESKDAILLDQTVETGDYAATLLGLVSGRELTDWDQNAQQSHTYAVMALKRLDGQPLDSQFDFISFTLTPLAAGYSPQAVNNWTLDAFATGFAQDGLYYYLLDTQDLNIFAHNTVYLAFYQGGAPSNSVFTMGADGQIAFRDDFQGVHALFTLPLDPAKGDPAAADAFAESTGLNHWLNLEDCPEEEPASQPSAALEPAEDEMDWMTEQQFQTYLEEELARMQREVQEGTLSQVNYNRDKAELEQTLEGIRQGTMKAALLEDGGLFTAQLPAEGSQFSVSSHSDDQGGVISEIKQK